MDLMIFKIKPREFYKELRTQKYGLKHAKSLVRVLKKYGHCYTETCLYILKKRCA